jgi:hypothetical protein
MRSTTAAAAIVAALLACVLILTCAYSIVHGGPT